MRVHPTRESFEVGLAAVILLAAGALLREAAVVAWGGAFVVGLAAAKTLARVRVARLRSAGFEMVWLEVPRSRSAARGESFTIRAELRNRDARPASFTALQAIASPYLEIGVTPSAGEIPARGRLSLVLHATAQRVGQHGVHGLSLEVTGGPGLFEVPLTFANPFGIEVLPRPRATSLRTARGGRSRMQAPVGRPGPFSGDGSTLRELREHQPGDPYRSIAWKASARRGSLVVRDFEREERDVVWLLLDASVELWSGRPGTAPLDLAIDEVASVSNRHLARGDQVGLAIVAARELVWHRPSRGLGREQELTSLLSRTTDTLDDDRSGLDEEAVAERVYEHLRSLEPAATARLRPTDLDRVARRAERLLERAPLVGREPRAVSARERVLRRYLNAFGLGSPPAPTPERPRSDLALADALHRLRRERPRPSLIYLWSVPLDPSRTELLRALRQHPRRHIALQWMYIDSLASLPTDANLTTAAATFAVAERLRVARTRSDVLLQRLGLTGRLGSARPGPRPRVRGSSSPELTGLAKLSTPERR